MNLIQGSECSRQSDQRQYNQICLQQNCPILSRAHSSNQTGIVNSNDALIGNGLLLIWYIGHDSR